LAGSWGVEPHTKSFGEIPVQPTDPSYKNCFFQLYHTLTPLGIHHPYEQNSACFLENYWSKTKTATLFGSGGFQSIFF